jgi:hypothetical protein
MRDYEDMDEDLEALLDGNILVTCLQHAWNILVTYS